MHSGLFGTIPNSPLFKLHHISPVWITIHYIYLLCTSLHRTMLQTTIFSFWYFILITVLPVNWNFYQNYAILTVEWSQNTISICICIIALNALGGRNMSLVAIQENYFLKTKLHLLVFLVSFIRGMKNLYVWYCSGTQLDQLLHPSQVVSCLCGLRIR